MIYMTEEKNEREQMNMNEWRHVKMSIEQEWKKLAAT